MRFRVKGFVISSVSESSSTDNQALQGFLQEWQLLAKRAWRHAELSRHVKALLRVANASKKRIKMGTAYDVGIAELVAAHLA